MTLRQLAACGVLLVAPIIVIDGCGPSAPAEHAEAPQHVIEYTVRGAVISLPDPDNPLSELQIHHEPIPAFKANYNETTPTGMNAMVMPFPPGEGVSIDSLTPGDKVTVTFTVEYNEDNGSVVDWHATSFAPLAPDTELHFGTADEHAGHNHGAHHSGDEYVGHQSP